MATEPIEESPRYKRQIDTAYPAAFELLRYRCDDGTDMLVWNSRDGEIPSRFPYDGREFRFKCHKGVRSTILPDRADLVITSYTRQQWLDWVRLSWQASCDRDPSYKVKTPTPEDFLRIAPFEHGMVRVISRHQYLAETHEWQGRLGS